MATHPANGSLHGPGITRISVTGFKSLANKTDVEIRPLTVLAGANSSGKSALMQPLLLMKQTLESSVNPSGPFLLAGPYARYSEARQFLSRTGTSGSSAQRLLIDFQLGQMTAAGFAYGVESENTFDVVETRGLEGADQVKPGEWSISKSSSSDYLKSLAWMDVLASHKGLTEFSVERYKFYQCIRATGPSGVASPLSEVLSLHAVSILNSEIRRTIYVPGIRGNQHRKWLLADVPVLGTFEGPFESYVPSLIESWQQASKGQKMVAVVGGLRLLGLAAGVEAKKLNESELELYVPRTRGSGDGDFVNIADVGLAVSTVLPVLVALIQADPGQLVYIEQPELHLHPRAQWKLAQLLVQAANRGVRLVIETHSSLLLQGILTCVAKGEITPETVALHWFARDEEGVTRVKTADLDSEGRVGDWPVDFDDVELEATNRYLDAVELRPMAGKGAA